MSRGAGPRTGRRGPEKARNRERKNDSSDAHGALTRFSNAVVGPQLPGDGIEAADPPP